MKYIRITSRLDGKLVAEQLYFGDDKETAVERFLSDYPSHKNCDIKAEPYESEDPGSKEHFAICQRCGCVN